MDENILFLNRWRSELDIYIQGVECFIKNQNNNHLAYIQSFRSRVEIGFNAFTLASDTYYRENYHSYILYEFLNPNSKHGEGYKYLHRFIDLINHTNKVPKIEYEAFANAEVFREWNDIDVLIKDDINHTAIIIENKINSAGDQPRQLPRYYHLLEKTYDILAIVYLPLDASKSPSKKDWTPDEINAIDKLLCNIPSYHTNSAKTNLLHHWLVPCMGASAFADNTFILKHYGELIKYLNTNTMDNVVLSKFRESLLQDNNHQTAISIRNMLNDLPEYLAIRIIDRYRGSHHPFTNLVPYQKRDVVFAGFEYEGGSWKIDIWCDENGYVMHLWEANSKELDVKAVFLPIIPELNDFEIHSGFINNIKKTFKLSEEEKLFATIDLVLKKLSEIKG